MYYLSLCITSNYYTITKNRTSIYTRYIIDACFALLLKSVKKSADIKLANRK